MPNGGRIGDNPQSWFMDKLCSGEETYLGEPIDSLACEIYRVSKHEHGAETLALISPKDNMDEIDPIELEAKLRKTLAEEKDRRKQRIEEWINRETIDKNSQTPDHIRDPIRETAIFAMKYCNDCMKHDHPDIKQIDELMYVINDLRQHCSQNTTPLDIRKFDFPIRWLNQFDQHKWEGAPNFVAFLESAVLKAMRQDIVSNESENYIEKDSSESLLSSGDLKPASSKAGLVKLTQPKNMDQLSNAAFEYGHRDKRWNFWLSAFEGVRIQEYRNQDFIGDSENSITLYRGECDNFDSPIKQHCEELAKIELTSRSLSEFDAAFAEYTQGLKHYPPAFRNLIGTAYQAHDKWNHVFWFAQSQSEYFAFEWWTLA